MQLNQLMPQATRDQMRPDQAGRLPAEVLDALARGRSIEAVKLLRDSTGISLKDAKDVIDGHLRNHPVMMRPTVPVGRLPFSVVEALQRGNKIEAIKLLREQTSVSLKEAKDAVEAVERGMPAKVSKLSPGEVPRSNVGWWIFLIAIIAIAAYYFLRSPN